LPLPGSFDILYVVKDASLKQLIQKTLLSWKNSGWKGFFYPLELSLVASESPAWKRPNLFIRGLRGKLVK
jgi:hypothetical protein